MPPSLPGAFHGGMTKNHRRHPGQDAVDAAGLLNDDVVRVYAVGGHEVADRSSLALRSTVRIDEAGSALVRFDTPCGASSGYMADDSRLHVMPIEVGAHAKPLIRARMRALLHALDVWALRLGSTTCVVECDGREEVRFEQGSVACLREGLYLLTAPGAPMLLGWSDVAAILTPETFGGRITILRLDGTIMHVRSLSES
jgi:hypothetical protein